MRIDIFYQGGRGLTKGKLNLIVQFENFGWYKFGLID